MNYKEFLEVTQKKRGKKFFKITKSWGVHDALNYIRRHKWFNIGRPLKEQEFYSIIRSVNTLLAKSFVEGADIHFPHGMGVLELRLNKKGVFLNNKGHLVNTYPINWEKTMKLWYENEEARTNKTVIRNENDVYKIYYNKYKANYINQCFYEFAPNRFIQKSLKGKIMKGEIDTLW